MRKLIVCLLLLFTPFLLYGQKSTYVSNGTTYYTDEYYKNGNPKVKRSAKARMEFLKSIGLTKTPKGYEVDHIIPLHQGGPDTPNNMQLLTIEEHKEKTKKERTTHKNYTSKYQNR